jgi:hypothetical protein
MPTYFHNIFYAKIARKDFQGNDNTLSLQELNDLVLAFSDINTTINLNIISIAEYPTYYLYTIASNGSTWFPSTVDNNILNHTFSASAYTSSPYSLPLQTNVILTGSSYNVNSDVLQYFNTSSRIYTFGDTPNTHIIYTASAYFNPSAPGIDVYFGLSDPNGNGYIGDSLNTVTYTGETIIISGSFTPIENQSYCVYAYVDNTSPITIGDIQWSFTQSIAPNSANTLTVLEPYLLSNFNNSDCDILINNANGLEYDKDFMKVDYETGIIPTNQQEILSGSAERAPVKPYNYSAHAQILPRYNGVRTTSPDFNVAGKNYITDARIFPPTPITPNPSILTENGYSNTPNVEQTTAYFAYFTQIVNTSPILRNKSGIQMQYLINSDADVTNVNSDDVNYYNLIDSFEPGKKAYVSLVSNESTIYSEPQPILFSGEFYEPILYTLSGSDPLKWSNYINWLNQDGTSGSGVPNFNSNLSIPNQSVNLATYGVISFNSLIAKYNGYYTGYGVWKDSGGSVCDPNTTTPLYFEFTADAESKVSVNSSMTFYNGSNTQLYGNVIIYLSSSIHNPKIIIGNVGTGLIPTDEYRRFTATNNLLPNFTPKNGDKLFFQFAKGSPSSPAAGSETQLFQDVNVVINTSNLTIAPSTASFWYAGANSRNILTSSIQLAEAYGQYYQSDISESGFSHVKRKFTIEPGDEFRFEYQEGSYNVFKVSGSWIGVTGSYQSASIYVELDHPVPNVNTINLDHFTLRRKEKNVGIAVTLDQGFVPNVQQGFLFPQYPTDTIKKNLPDILNKLHAKNII